jgi:hypothetical protein
MEVRIVKEKQIEDKVYFEVLPVPEEYDDILVFGYETVADKNNEDQMILLRAQVMLLASDEFDKIIG